MKVSITLAENEGFFYNPSSFKNQEDLIVFLSTEFELFYEEMDEGCAC